MGRKLLCPLATRIDPPTPFPRPGAHPLLLPANWRFRTILSLHTCQPLLGQRKSCGWEGSRGTGRHPPPLQWGLPRHRCRESEGTGLRGHAPQENKVCARLASAHPPPACLPAGPPSPLRSPPLHLERSCGRQADVMSPPRKGVVTPCGQGSGLFLISPAAGLLTQERAQTLLAGLVLGGVLLHGSPT